MKLEPDGGSSLTSSSREVMDCGASSFASIRVSLYLDRVAQCKDHNRLLDTALMIWVTCDDDWHRGWKYMYHDSWQRTGEKQLTEGAE